MIVPLKGMCLPSFLSARFLERHCKRGSLGSLSARVSVPCSLRHQETHYCRPHATIRTQGPMLFPMSPSGHGILLQVPTPVRRDRAREMWRQGICVCRPLSWPVLLPTYWRQASRHRLQPREPQCRLIVDIRQYRRPHSSFPYQLNPLHTDHAHTLPP
jgi:hypothetical protein